MCMRMPVYLVAPYCTLRETVSTINPTSRDMGISGVSISRNGVRYHSNTIFYSSNVQAIVCGWELQSLGFPELCLVTVTVIPGVQINWSTVTGPRAFCILIGNALHFRLQKLTKFRGERQFLFGKSHFCRNMFPRKTCLYFLFSWKKLCTHETQLGKIYVGFVWEDQPYLQATNFVFVSGNQLLRGPKRILRNLDKRGILVALNRRFWLEIRAIQNRAIRIMRFQGHGKAALAIDRLRFRLAILSDWVAFLRFLESCNSRLAILFRQGMEPCLGKSCACSQIPLGTQSIHTDFVLGIICGNCYRKPSLTA